MKKKIPLPILIIAIGCTIGVVIAGFGLSKQISADKINKERADTALKESEAAVKVANERLLEIKGEYTTLQEQYEQKASECDAITIDINDDEWFAKQSKCSREQDDLHSKLWDLEQEDTLIRNRDYTVLYQKVEPMSYIIFYIIGGSIAAAALLGAFIIYLVKGKKTY